MSHATVQHNGGRRNVGQRQVRLDGAPKVRGEAAYLDDRAVDGLLHGAVLRSPHPHALIRHIDTRRASAMPGVRAVITAADVPETRYGIYIKDATVFARDRVHFAGEPVAAVAADTLEEARAAVAAIVVDYAPLPGVFDPEAALRDDAPLVHPEWEQYQAAAILVRRGNRSARGLIRHGNVEEGFAKSFRIFEHRFTTSKVHAGYTEPRGSIGFWHDDGSCTVWSSTQLPFAVQELLADAVGLPSAKVRVVATTLGGGFGGKLAIGVEHHAVLLARAAKAPVKVVSTVEEELTSALPRQPAIVDIKVGVDRDGIILAKQGRILLDTGAFSGSGPQTASSCTNTLHGPYNIPNVLLEGVSVYTNNMNTGAFRAPSGPIGNFACESQMDIIAESLGIDPLELRLRNIFHEGDKGPSGATLAAVGLEECLRRAADAIGWNDRKQPKGRGKGIACGWWMTTGMTSEVDVTLYRDGHVLMNSGAVEIGTGALTGSAQVLADGLGVEAQNVTVIGGDTGASPFDYGAQGSRTTFCVGNACRDAAAEMRKALAIVAAPQLGVTPDAVELRDGAVHGGGRSLAFAVLVGADGLKVRGTFTAPAVAYDASRLENHQSPAWHAPSFHAHAVDLSVDEDTGEVTLHRYVVAQDVGFAINPTYVEGQIEGGAVQGIGQALFEEIVSREGIVQNPNLTDYKMPTMQDVPRIETILVQHPTAHGPSGAKGVGEPPCIEPPATIGNAIAAATGARVSTLPMTAERICAARGKLAP
jgi:CO/xanthine dehydrogenase Mo-binding subunit